MEKGLLATILIILFGICGLPFYLLHQAYRSLFLGLPRSPWINTLRKEPSASLRQYLGIECWVIGRTLFATFVLWQISLRSPNILLFAVQASLFADLIRLLLFLHMNPKASQFSGARSLAAIGLHYVETILFFATCYLTFQNDASFSIGRLSPWQAIYFSSITITTVGYGDISPKAVGIQVIAILETFVGVAIIVVAIARVIGFDSQPGGHSDDVSIPE